MTCGTPEPHIFLCASGGDRVTTISTLPPATGDRSEQDAQSDATRRRTGSTMATFAPVDDRTSRGTAEARGPPPRDMDVEFVSRTAPNEKATVLAEAPGVTRLVKVSCHKDPAWSLELLQRAAPTVERLSVGHPQEAHLLAVHAMPRLRRLHVMMGADADLDAPPVVLPALPPGRAGLQCLTVSRLPRATTQSLLLAHGRALEELQLWVGTAGSLPWPRSCGDLHSLLEQCGLRALRRLVLVRAHKFSHETAACGEQLAEVRRVLPSAEVLCDVCDSVEVEEV